ncbi:outer membrane protein assembly factor BamA [Candidatus Pelagibacter sp.]|nr:outer membrane protein assembly factor BamA [Candidatus Pelagibacter sp.]
MFNYLSKFFLIFIIFTTHSLSETYDDIVIMGNKRISNDTIKVFSIIPDKKNINENEINIILKNLYETGFFNDVSVKIENNKLIISVIENPIIQTVFIEGVKSRVIRESLMDILTLKDRSSFNRSKLKLDESVIINFLKNKGYYFAALTTSTENLDNNSINLTHTIEIGQKAKISKISFLGDKKIKDSKLRDVIISEEHKFWKFISNKKFINEELINFDKQLLNNFYKNKGFFDVKINASFANYLGNNEFELIYNISSGKKYFFNNVKLSLPLDYDVSNFTKLNKIFLKLKGKNYSLNAIDKILQEIDNIVLNEQFESLTSEVNEELIDNLINLTFNISEADKFYIERINILGNNITRENVIRDSLYVDEGDSFNDLLHTKSINNIKSLNFFRDVKSEILAGTDDNQKIINISVEEKPTGEITAGAGMSTSGGTVAFAVNENNFLGRGIKLGTDVTLSEESLKGKISLNNPNYNGSNRSLNFILESSVNDRLKDFGYKSSKTGFSIGTGLEFYDDLFLVTGLSTYIENLETDATASASLVKQKGSFFDTFFNYTLDYDKRNQKFQTTDGFRSRFTQNLPLISENYSLTNTYNYKFFNTWLKENVATIGVYASATNSITNKDVKLSDRINLPSSKLRGFESGKIGPKDGADFIGGNYATAITVATTLPQILPSFQSLDFSIFLDVANVWGVDYSSTISDGSAIRSSFGIGVDYFTPIGPLNFSLTEVISKGSNDITESFRFNLGTTF